MRSFYIGAGAALLLPPLLALTVILFGACRQQQTVKPVPSVQSSPTTAAVSESPATVGSQGLRTFSGTGVVTVVNRKDGWVEIKHEEIKGEMPAMQMAWYLKEPSLIGSINVGDKVNFEIENNRGTEVLTKLEKVESR